MGSVSVCDGVETLENDDDVDGNCGTLYFKSKFMWGLHGLVLT
jgi:hypothetical protein